MPSTVCCTFSRVRSPSSLSSGLTRQILPLGPKVQISCFWLSPVYHHGAQDPKCLQLHEETPRYTGLSSSILTDDRGWPLGCRNSNTKRCHKQAQGVTARTWSVPHSPSVVTAVIPPPSPHTLAPLIFHNPKAVPKPQIQMCH